MKILAFILMPVIILIALSIITAARKKNLDKKLGDNPLVRKINDNTQGTNEFNDSVREASKYDKEIGSVDGAFKFKIIVVLIMIIAVLIFFFGKATH